MPRSDRSRRRGSFGQWSSEQPEPGGITTLTGGEAAGMSIGYVVQPTDDPAVIAKNRRRRGRR